MEKFLEMIKEREPEYLADLKKLIQAVSVKDTPAPNAPFGKGVRKALDTFLEMGKRDGFETEDVDGYAGVIKYGQGDQMLGILGHLDVVPLGKGWTKPADDLSVEDGVVYGRGVLDDKGPLLAAYYALKMVRDAGIPLNKEIYLIAGTDEESGMGCMKYYKKHGRIPDLGFTPDGSFPLIYSEKGTALLKLSYDGPTCIKSFESDPQVNVVISEATAVLDENAVDEKGFEEFCKEYGCNGSIAKEEDGVHILMKGKAAHASVPWLGNNAGIHLLHYIAEAYKDPFAKALYECCKEWSGKGLDINVDGKTGPLTMNTGYLLKNGSVFECWLDIRFPDETSADEIMKKAQKVLDSLDVDIVLSLENTEHPLYVDPESELVTKLMKSYQKFTGDYESKPMAIGGGTYAKHFDNFVAFGPEKDEHHPENAGGCHEPDEGIYLDDLLESAAIYADAIVELAGA